MTYRLHGDNFTVARRLPSNLKNHNTKVASGIIFIHKLTISTSLSQLVIWILGRRTYFQKLIKKTEMMMVIRKTWKVDDLYSNHGISCRSLFGSSFYCWPLKFICHLFQLLSQKVFLNPIAYFLHHSSWTLRALCS